MDQHLAVGGLLVDGFTALTFYVSMAIAVFEAFTLVDAAIRREDAYRAADKQSKAFWLVILAVAVALNFTPLGVFFSILGLVASLVYMVDVRPKLRAVTPRRNGRKKNDHVGPYGPW